jgi:hypothetical protein
MVSSVIIKDGITYRNVSFLLEEKYVMAIDEYCKRTGTKKKNFITESLMAKLEQEQVPVA